jgi:hypothetical protein
MQRRLIATLAVAGLLALFAGSVLSAKADTEATLLLSEGSVAAGVGWNWGSGTLTYQGKSYPVKVSGLSVGEVGVTNAVASGTVHHLKSLDDFDGLYAAAAAEATAGTGKGIAGLVNAKGVTIDLKSDTQGVSLKVAAEGLKVSLQT